MEIKDVAKLIADSKNDRKPLVRTWDLISRYVAGKQSLGGLVALAEWLCSKSLSLSSRGAVRAILYQDNDAPRSLLFLQPCYRLPGTTSARLARLGSPGTLNNPQTVAMTNGKTINPAQPNVTQPNIP